MKRIANYGWPVLVALLLNFSGAWSVTNAEETAPATGPSQTLKGTVLLNGKPVAGAEVRLVYRAAREKGVKGANQAKQQVLATTTSGPDGQFAFGSIDPGNYMIVAGLRRQQERGREIVNIKAGQSTVVQIDLGAGNAGKPTTNPAPVKKKKKA